MAFEPGGISEKLGNRYEGRWVAKQLLRLLNEELLSVTVELIGSEEEGVDLLVVKKDNVRRLQQCKARYGNQNSWSVKALATRGILGHLQNHLCRDQLLEFVLVSSIPAQPLVDICDSARNSNDNPQDFYKYQIQNIGKQRQDAFSDFCAALELKPDEPEDLTTVFDYLKRTYIELFPDDRNTWSDLLTLAGFLLTGEPETAIDVLFAYAENHDKYRKPIYADELRSYLTEHHNINSKGLNHDYRIAPAVEELRLQFYDSILPGLIQGAIIPRVETQQILECIVSGQDVILHGAAGYGKSGILYELSEHLNQKRIPFLTVRLDRRIPDKTARQFGVDMGLPDSPVYSLAGLAAGRKSVLILDQLDAIRWTAAHSSAAMDVCKELVRQIRSLRKEGVNIVTVFACRTFDLEHDPEIKGLITGQNNQCFAKIVVKELSENQLKPILGVSSYNSLTGAQKRILACPHNLAIWMELKKNEMIPPFRSATDLMRRFWINCRQVIEEKTGITAVDVDAFLQPILDYMESRGEISIPSSLAAKNPRIRDALISYGILQQSVGRISFCHQRYLDHLIAELLLNQIFKGTGSILLWLGPREKQSLVRREQLRQILDILAEELPSDFLANARSLLNSTEVRFHLKHLILEVIGLLKDIDKNIGKYCHELIGVNHWQEHILETVYLGHTPWVLYLLKQGILSKWLSSQEEPNVNRSLLLLRSVAEHIQDQVTDTLQPYLKKGSEWPSRILNTICWKVHDDSEKMYEMRLQLARIGFVQDFVSWKPYCEKYPLRAIRLIEAVMSTWQIGDKQKTTHKKGRLEKWYDEDSQALNHAVKQNPVQTWDLLVGHIERLTSIDSNGRYEPRLKRWQDRLFDTNDEDIARGAVNLVIFAGQTMAAKQSNDLIKRALTLSKSISPIIQEIIISSYTYLPNTHADIGIDWLLGDPVRFRIGSGYREPAWMPAVRLIKALSPHCSEEVFRTLEEAITCYHAPNERQDAEYYLKGWRRGNFGYYWGETQYFLLPALDQKRIHKTTADLIHVLERKFGNYPIERFNKSRVGVGGWVGSKLDPNLKKISDGAWLRIISSDKVNKGNTGKGIQVSPDRVLETSVRQFAGSLSTMAKKDPERFGQLALQFPESVNHRFVSAIIDSFILKEPDKTFSEEEKRLWQPARIETIEAVLAKFKLGDDRDIAMSFCRLIAGRADQAWSEQNISRLVRYAKSHPDLPEGKLNLHCNKNCDEASVHILFQNTINCVRGVAAGAIGSLLWAEKDRLKQVRPGIEALVQDPHPAVRMAAIEAIEPVLTFDKDLSVQWFCKICEKDLRVAASPRALRFFNYVIPSHVEQVAPIILQMMTSPFDEVALEGACQLTARWLFHGFFADELALCRAGNVSQRKGVARVAAQLLRNRKYYLKCKEILQNYFDDVDKEVRDELRIMLRNDGLDKIGPDHQGFLQAYIKSQTFADNPDYFVRHLVEYAGNLIPLSELIFTVCEEFATTLKEKLRDVSSRFPYTAIKMLPILLRLYEHALGEGNRQIANRCLDIWDILFKNRVGRAIELTRSIDS
jgi:hypothetical protein